DGVCDSSTGTCSHPIRNDGTPCDDHNLCTPTSTCQAGVCTDRSRAGQAQTDDCHDRGVCDPTTGQAGNAPRAAGTGCNDKNACTTNDRCDGNGTCVGTTPVVCNAEDECHLPGVCDVATGVCSHPTRTDGTGCDDHNLCTPTSSCQAGVC